MLFRLLTRSQRFPNKVQLFSTRNLASLSKPRHVGPFPPGFLYNTFMKSTPIYVSCIFVGAIVGEYLWSNGFEMIWNYNNQGVSFDIYDNCLETLQRHRLFKMEFTLPQHG